MSFNRKYHKYPDYILNSNNPENKKHYFQNIVNKYKIEHEKKNLYKIL